MAMAVAMLVRIVDDTMEIAGQDAELPEIRRRARYFALVVLVAFLAIAGRLFYLQVIEGDIFYRVTSDSIIRTEPLPAVRGQIRDRKGKRAGDGPARPTTST